MAKKTRSARRKPALQPAIPALGRWLGAAILLAAIGAFVLWMLMRSDTPKPTFSGDRAYSFLVQQVEMGPRVPGTEAHARTLAFLADSLRQYADRVGRQAVPYVDRADSTRTYEGTNLIASFNVDAGRRIMLAAHWDTRPAADQDPDPAKRTDPVPGANDGASGVAVLLEMARLLHEQPPSVGVDLVFFDLEDLGDDVDPDSVEAGVVDSTKINPFAIGSEYFAEHYGTYRPSYGILLDMVCDRDLRIPRELYSNRYARPVVDKIWAAAERVGAPAFLDEEGQAVMDDHVPFLQRGIPVVDLIHTPFPDYWHTTADTPDKCSAASLQQVGGVLVEVVYSE